VPKFNDGDIVTERLLGHMQFAWFQYVQPISQSLEQLQFEIEKMQIHPRRSTSAMENLSMNMRLQCFLLLIWLGVLLSPARDQTAKDASFARSANSGKSFAWIGL
jgi:hypothetical protein